MGPHPGNIDFCKVVKCKHRQGNDCKLDECVRNGKRVRHWEETGTIVPEDD